MEQLYYKHGKFMVAISGIIALISMFAFDNIFVIAFFIALLLHSLYIVVSCKIEYDSPHIVIKNYIERLGRYRYLESQDIINKAVGLLNSLDNKIVALQGLTAYGSSKTEYKRASTEYVNKALKVVKSNVESLIAVCALEDGPERNERAEHIIGRIKHLLETIDDLIISISNVNYNDDTALIQRIKDYVYSLDELT